MGNSTRRNRLSYVSTAALSLLMLGLASGQAAAPPDGPPRIPGQNPNGIQVYLRAGLKTHGPGLHDYPQFLADWSKFLTEHGAVVTGSLHAPLAEELSKVAVLVIYKGDAGYLSDEDRKALEAFIKRGGGIVSIHDALCGPDPAYFATLVGGAKKHGEVNYTLEANVPYTVVDSSSPLMKDIAGVTLRDEAFFNMTWAANPKIHVLATTVIDGTPSAGTHKGEVVPQIWTFEHSLAGGQPARAFVWMQGHKYANFSEPQIQNMLLRAIAWAGRHPVEELVDYRPPPRPQGPPGAQPPAPQPPAAATQSPADQPPASKPPAASNNPSSATERTSAATAKPMPAIQSVPAPARAVAGTQPRPSAAQPTSATHS
ncbi:MAG TPA: ThuA domain-containing protein [Steroidobacteraceae bacterium]